MAEHAEQVRAASETCTLQAAAAPRPVSPHSALPPQFSLARIGTAIVSWYPPGDGGKGSHFDELFPRLLDIFGQRGLKVAVHLEPFKDRSAAHLRRVFQYIAEKYGAHPALARYA